MLAAKGGFCGTLPEYAIRAAMAQAAARSAQQFLTWPSCALERARPAGLRAAALPTRDTLPFQPEPLNLSDAFCILHSAFQILHLEESRAFNAGSELALAPLMLISR